MHLQFALQLEQTKFEEKKKLEEQDFSRLKKDKVRSEIEISALKQELEVAKRTHEEHVSQLELQATESKAEYEKKIEELKRHLANARKQVKDLEAFSESRSLNWKNKEHTYQSFLNYQLGAFQVYFFVYAYSLIWYLLYGSQFLSCAIPYSLMLYRN